MQTIRKLGRDQHNKHLGSSLGHTVLRGSQEAQRWGAYFRVGRRNEFFGRAADENIWSSSQTKYHLPARVRSLRHNFQS